MERAQRGILAVALLVCALCGRGQAALIGIELEYPLLVTYDLQVDYVAGQPAENGQLSIVGTFVAYGTAMQVHSADGTVGMEDQYYGSFSLTAEIDKATKTAVSGSLDVWSDTDWDTFLDLQRASSADLAEFGFGGDGVFDFWFCNASGDLVNTYGTVGAIVDAMTPGFDPSFEVDFSNAGSGKGDIPEPATVGLLALGGLGLLGRRRKR